MEPTENELPPELDSPDLSPAHRAALLEVLIFAEGLTGERDRAVELIRREPLRVFGGLTAIELVAQGRVPDVREYLESIAGGAAG